MSFPLQPQGDRLLVSPFKRKEEKLGSLHIPATANADLDTGEIIAVSPDLLGYNVGDIICFPAKTGVGQLIAGTPCLWLTQRDIWGVWDKETWTKLNAENE